MKPTEYITISPHRDRIRATHKITAGSHVWYAETDRLTSQDIAEFFLNLSFPVDHSQLRVERLGSKAMTKDEAMKRVANHLLRSIDDKDLTGEQIVQRLRDASSEYVAPEGITVGLNDDLASIADQIEAIAEEFVS